MNAGDGDLFVLGLPLASSQEGLALVAYLGGLSAAAAMVVVASVALSTMISNDLVMPVLLRYERLRPAPARDLSRLILAIRRGAILVLLAAGLRLLPSGRQPSRSSVSASSPSPASPSSRPPILPASTGAGQPLGAAGRHLGRGRGLALHPGPAGLGLGRADRCRLRRAGCLRDRAAAPQALLGPHRPRRHGGHAVVWSLGVNLTLLVLVRPAQPAEQPRAGAGGLLRRCRPGRRRRPSSGAARRRSRRCARC